MPIISVRSGIRTSMELAQPTDDASLLWQPCMYLDGGK